MRKLKLTLCRVRARVEKHRSAIHVSKACLELPVQLNHQVSANEWMRQRVPSGAEKLPNQTLPQFLTQRIMNKTSLVAQWLRIRLPMQGTQVRALVQEDPTCRGTTKPVRHNYWACALEPVSYNYWACVLQLLKPTCLEPVLCNKRSHHNESPRTTTMSSPRSPQLEKACMQQWRANTARKEGRKEGGKGGRERKMSKQNCWKH